MLSSGAFVKPLLDTPHQVQLLPHGKIKLVHTQIELQLVSPLPPSFPLSTHEVGKYVEAINYENLGKAV